MAKRKIEDINPETKAFCHSCKYWDPVGFYTWQREENPKMRECKHMKRCNRIYKLASAKQMTINDYQNDAIEIVKGGGRD